MESALARFRQMDCAERFHQTAETEEQKCSDSVLTGPATGFAQMKRNCASEMAAQMGKEQQQL